MKIKVYGTLSIIEEEVRALLPGAILAPPIERGDLLQDIRAGYHVVVIIDGRFSQVCAVAPAEISDALRAGIRVYGSSSMGAMRASELCQHGMIGHGLIFQHILEQPYFRDDFLGQVYDSVRGAGNSVPYIDLFFNAGRLVTSGKLSARDSAFILKAYAALPYPQRNFRALSEVLGRSARGRSLLGIVKKAFGMPSQKGRDARDLLKRVGRELRGVASFNAGLHRAQRRRPRI